MRRHSIGSPGFSGRPGRDQIFFCRSGKILNELSVMSKRWRDASGIQFGAGRDSSEPFV